MDAVAVLIIPITINEDEDESDYEGDYFGQQEEGTRYHYIGKF